MRSWLKNLQNLKLALSAFLREKFSTRSLSKAGISDGKTIVALAAVVLFSFMASILMTSSLKTPREVLIEEGSGVYAIADTLKEEGIIGNKFVFVVYTMVTGNEKMLKAGKYVFESGATIPDIVYAIANGLAESNDLEVVIPEGFNVFEIDNQLASMELINRGEFVRKYHTKEGFLFPDTYRINREICGTDKSSCLEEIGKKMIKNFDEKADGISKTNLIIASMLEKEARTEEDMAIVAGIIKNRIEKKVLLQIDAAVSYGACIRNLESFLSRHQVPRYCDVSQIGVAAEIKLNSPYNTYLRAGLPLGPISNPGLKAIKAALHPVDTDFMYYLSTRDGSRIIYSKTAAEHAANRKKYLGI